MWLLRVTTEQASYDSGPTYLDLYFEDYTDAKEVGDLIGRNLKFDGLDYWISSPTERNYITAELFQLETYDIDSAIAELQAQYRHSKNSNLYRRLEDAKNRRLGNS